MRSIRARASALVAIALAALGCENRLPAPIPAAHPAESEPRRGGTVQIASFGDVRAIDPANITDGLAPQILQHLFAGLVDYDASGKIVPDLAERMEVLDGARTYRFTLRRGVRFHDGDELTAEDVKRSSERALHPSAPNPYTGNFASLMGLSELTSKAAEHVSGIEVEGRYVVTYRLKQADAAFLPLLAMHMLRPTCRSAGDRYSDTWHPCGAGPFKLEPNGWDRGRELTLVRHEGYFHPGLPYVDRVRWTFHVTQSSQSFKFMRGDLDVYRDFNMADLLRFQADARWTPFGEYEAEKQIGGDAMNVEMPPFDNVEIRRAVAAALDRDQLRLVRAANLRAAGTPVPPSVAGYDPTLTGQRYDLDAALEHMRRAGYPYDPVTKKGGYPHVVPYLVYKQGLAEFMGQVVAQQLAKIGIRIELRMVNYPTFIALRGRRNGAAFGAGFWQQDYPEAGSFLEPLFHSRSIANEDSNNWSFYANPRVDELIDRARAEPEESRRLGLYREAQEIVCDEAPWAFTYYYRWYVQRQPYLRDYRSHPVWSSDFTRSWLDRALGPTAARTIFSKDALANVLRGRP
jgi:ABC-type transport system substrate-binding protein